METAVVKCLKRIRKETPRRMTDLRESCDKLIGSSISPRFDRWTLWDYFVVFISIPLLLTLQYFPVIDTLSTNLKAAASTSQVYGASADQFFLPFQVACESRLPRLMEVGLDGIHYLIGKYSSPMIVDQFLQPQSIITSFHKSNTQSFARKLMAVSFNK